MCLVLTTYYPYKDTVEDCFPNNQFAWCGDEFVNYERVAECYEGGITQATDQLYSSMYKVCDTDGKVCYEECRDLLNDIENSYGCIDTDSRKQFLQAIWNAKDRPEIGFQISTEYMQMYMSCDHRDGIVPSNDEFANVPECQSGSTPTPSVANSIKIHLSVVLVLPLVFLVSHIFLKC